MKAEVIGGFVSASWSPDVRCSFALLLLHETRECFLPGDIVDVHLNALPRFSAWVTSVDNSIHKIAYVCPPMTQAEMALETDREARSQTVAILAKDTDVSLPREGDKGTAQLVEKGEAHKLSDRGRELMARLDSLADAGSAIHETAKELLNTISANCHPMFDWDPAMPKSYFRLRSLKTAVAQTEDFVKRLVNGGHLPPIEGA